MNLYTKLLCYLGLIKAPTLDIVQWIKDNPEKVLDSYGTYNFTYKGKEFLVCFNKEFTYVGHVKYVFNIYENDLLWAACRGALRANRARWNKHDTEQAERVRKELLE